MDTDEFIEYIPEFISYKDLSEKMEPDANNILKEDKILYPDFAEN